MKKEKKNEIKKIKLGFPSREWQRQTVKLFELADYKVKLEKSLCHLKIDDPEIECVLARTEEIASYVEKGIMDAGITQKVHLLEQNVKVVEVVDLNYGNDVWWNTRLVLAVPKDSKIKSAKDLEGRKILTRVSKIAEEYFKRRGVKAKIEWSDRPTEPKIPIFGDATIEFTNTGNTLRTHNLKIIDVLMETSPKLIANQEIWKNKWKKEKIEKLGMLLKGARLGQEYSSLMLHASNDMMERVWEILPALKKPTITHLRGENWFDVFTVVKKKEIRELIPKLKKIGCTDIIEIPLKKVII